MVDISGNALEKAGFSINRLKELKDLGVTGLRMDYHISNETIAKVSQELTVSLNASTITPKDIDELKEHKANFSKLEAWHNYYPRPETGLSREGFLKKNERVPAAEKDTPRAGRFPQALSAAVQARFSLCRF